MSNADLSWAELVLHVLAHLEATATLPGSVYDVGYVERARQYLGDPADRSLGTDVEILSAQLATHEQLVDVQAILRLHPSIRAAKDAAHRELVHLRDCSGANAAICSWLHERCPVAAELVRCAALLEADAFERWPLPRVTEVEQRICEAVPDLWSVAPRLRTLPIRTLRGLGMRGRAWPDAIWVGIPDGSGAPTLEHVLWQAAHESTVVEVNERAELAGISHIERHIEMLAVALLHRRTARLGEQSDHARWLTNFEPSVRDWANEVGLSETERQWLDTFAFDSLERTP